jgi:hypothetical protein
MQQRIPKEGSKDATFQGKLNLEQKQSLTFIMILPLTVGCVSLSLQSKYDKALRYCIGRSSFCHNLKMKILIILLNNCHSISSL